MEKILIDLAKVLIPDILYPAKHIGLAFICFIGGIALYSNLMLNDDEVDNWKERLKWKEHIDDIRDSTTHEDNKNV